MHQIFYLTIDPERALGIEDLIPSYHIIHPTISQLDEPIKDKGIDIQNFSLEDTQSTAKLLESEKVQKYIKKNQHGVPDLLVFKNEKKIEELCVSLGYRLLNPSAEVSKKYENKVEFAEFIRNISIFEKPVYEAFEKLSDVQYSEMSEKLHHELVVQFMFGHSGNSTYYIHNEKELEELKSKFPLRKGKIAKKIAGIPYTINACITKLGVVIGGISEQITGIESLTSSLGGTVGNDFTQRHLNDALRRTLIEKTMQFGEELRNQGHRGIFGLDLILDSEKQDFYLIEANVRQTMSCSFVSYLQRREKHVPIMLWHVLELIGQDFDQSFICLDEEIESWINQEIQAFKNGDQLEYNIAHNQPIEASQVFFRNINEYDIKILEQFPEGIYRIRGRLPNESAQLEDLDAEKYPAVFRLREDGWSSLCLVKRGYTILDADEEGGFLITAAAEGNVIPPLGEIGRMQFLGSAFSSETSDDLNGWIRDSIKAIYENMRFSKNV